MKELHLTRSTLYDDVQTKYLHKIFTYSIEIIYLHVHKTNSYAHI